MRETNECYICARKFPLEQMIFCSKCRRVLCPRCAANHWCGTGNLESRPDGDSIVGFPDKYPWDE